MSIRRVALLTAGGFAPCLSAAVGDLIERYTQVAPEVEIIAYQYGYHGLLTGNYIVIDEEGRKNAGILRDFGGSPIGNSRVKLTNAKNLVERGLVKEGVNPLEFAAEQLRKDGVDVDEVFGLCWLSCACVHGHSVSRATGRISPFRCAKHWPFRGWDVVAGELGMAPDDGVVGGPAARARGEVP